MLPHTERIAALLREGRVQEAKRLHHQRVHGQIRAARQGRVINLTDLMAAKEQIHLHEVDLAQRGAIE